MLTLLTVAALAAEPLDREAYEAAYPLEDDTSEHYDQIEACLASWGAEHPFTNPESRRFRTLHGATRVAGLGSDATVRDEVVTAHPVLVLVKPNVAVMSRTIWWLENPNGWYCFDTTVAVVAKSVVNLTCGAHLADARSAFSVGGRSARDGGVNVFGKLVVNEGDCPEESEAADNAEEAEPTALPEPTTDED